MRLIDADVLAQEVKKSMNTNTYNNSQTMINHILEHMNFLRLIESAPEIDLIEPNLKLAYYWVREGNHIFRFPLEFLE